MVNTLINSESANSVKGLIEILERMRVGDGFEMSLEGKLGAQSAFNVGLIESRLSDGSKVYNVRIIEL